MLCNLCVLVVSFIQFFNLLFGEFFMLYTYMCSVLIKISTKKKRKNGDVNKCIYVYILISVRILQQVNAADKFGERQRISQRTREIPNEFKREKY